MQHWILCRIHRVSFMADLTQFCDAVSDYKQICVMPSIYTKLHTKYKTIYKYLQRNWYLAILLTQGRTDPAWEKCTRTQSLHNELVTYHMICRVYGPRSGSCWQLHPHVRKEHQHPHMSTMESWLQRRSCVAWFQKECIHISVKRIQIVLGIVIVTFQK